MGKSIQSEKYHFCMSFILSRFFFFFLINAFTCNMLSICIPHVGISKIKEICMSILLINGIIVFGNDKRDDD